MGWVGQGGRLMHTCMNWLMCSLSLKISDSVLVPITLRNVVAANNFVEPWASSTFMMDIVASKMRA